MGDDRLPAARARVGEVGQPHGPDRAPGRGVEPHGRPRVRHGEDAARGGPDGADRPVPRGPEARAVLAVQGHDPARSVAGVDARPVRDHRAGDVRDPAIGRAEAAARDPRRPAERALALRGRDEVAGAEGEENERVRRRRARGAGHARGVGRPVHPPAHPPRAGVDRPALPVAAHGVDGAPLHRRRARRRPAEALGPGGRPRARVERRQRAEARGDEEPPAPEREPPARAVGRRVGRGRQVAPPKGGARARVERRHPGAGVQHVDQAAGGDGRRGDPVAARIARAEGRRPDRDRHGRQRRVLDGVARRAVGVGPGRMVHGRRGGERPRARRKVRRRERPPVAQVEPLARERRLPLAGPEGERRDDEGEEPGGGPHPSASGAPPRAITSCSARRRRPAPASGSSRRAARRAAASSVRPARASIRAICSSASTR